MYAITTLVKGKMLFVSECSKRSLDNKYLVDYSLQECDAIRFEKSEAEGIMPTIHNPFERKFTVEKVKGETRKKVPANEANGDGRHAEKDLW